jgi:hypothetical protein
LSGVLVKHHLLEKKGEQQTAQQSQIQPVDVAKLSALDIDWKQSKQTLLLAISSSCHFCTDSAPFYRRLTQNRGGTRIVAVLPQSTQEGQEYLKRLGVSIGEVRQLGLDRVGVRGTPTLLLVDEAGVVTKSWVGQLSPDQEKEVLSRL